MVVAEEEVAAAEEALFLPKLWLLAEAAEAVVALSHRVEQLGQPVPEPRQQLLFRQICLLIVYNLSHKS